MHLKVLNELVDAKYSVKTLCNTNPIYTTEHHQGIT